MSMRLIRLPAAFWPATVPSAAFAFYAARPLYRRHDGDILGGVIARYFRMRRLSISEFRRGKMRAMGATACAETAGRRRRTDDALSAAYASSEAIFYAEDALPACSMIADDARRAIECRPFRRQLLAMG